MSMLTLQSKYISQTMQRIHRRLQARLPQVGLLNVSSALVELCDQAAQRSRAIARPILWLRFLVAAFVVIRITGLTRMWNRCVTCYRTKSGRN